MKCQINHLHSLINNIPKLNQQVSSFLQHKQNICRVFEVLISLKNPRQNQSQNLTKICKKCQNQIHQIMKHFPQNEWKQAVTFKTNSFNSFSNCFTIQNIANFIDYSKIELGRIKQQCSFAGQVPTTTQSTEMQKHKTIKPLQPINKKDQQEGQGSGQNIIKNSLNLEEMKQNSTMEFIDLGKSIPPKNQDMIEQELKLGTQSNSDDKKMKPTQITEIKGKEKEMVREANNTNNNKCCKYCCCLLI